MAAEIDTASCGWDAAGLAMGAAARAGKRGYGAAWANSTSPLRRSVRRRRQNSTTSAIRTTALITMTNRSVRIYAYMGSAAAEVAAGAVTLALALRWASSIRCRRWRPRRSADILRAGIVTLTSNGRPEAWYYARRTSRRVLGARLLIPDIKCFGSDRTVCICWQ